MPDYPKANASCQLNYKAITKLYGREATVSSIEHHLRSFRSEGKELKVEAEKAAAEAEAALAAAAENGGDVGESSCANYLVDTSHALGKTAPKVTKTGTAKAKNGVQDGRVTKKRATVKKPLANTATKKSKMDVAAKTDVDVSCSPKKCLGLSHADE